MTTGPVRPDVSIDEVHTSLEIVDAAAPDAAQLRRLIKVLIQQCLREERELARSRDEDIAISDRAWRPHPNRR